MVIAVNGQAPRGRSSRTLVYGHPRVARPGPSASIGALSVCRTLKWAIITLHSILNCEYDKAADTPIKQPAAKLSLRYYE
jgi:hypothetical protein